MCIRFQDATAGRSQLKFADITAFLVSPESPVNK
jgi:hypothetical protein